MPEKAMASLYKETIAKVAGNVTQSVISAIVVFLITTYILVDSGRKSTAEKHADSLKIQLVVPPLQPSGSPQKQERIAEPSPTRETASGKAEEVPKERGMLVSEPSRRQESGTSGQKGTVKEEPIRTSPVLPAAAAASETKGGISPKKPAGHGPGEPARGENAKGQTVVGQEDSQGEAQNEPVVKKPAHTVSDTHAKEDTAEPKKGEVQKVKKRAQDAFDELDQEAQQKPPQ
jgi:hypothetical protein